MSIPVCCLAGRCRVILLHICGRCSVAEGVNIVHLGVGFVLARRAGSEFKRAVRSGRDLAETLEEWWMMSRTGLAMNI